LGPFLIYINVTNVLTKRKDNKKKIFVFILFFLLYQGMASIQNIFILCPHCQETIVIDPIACGTTIHGALLTSKGYIQLDPHSSRETCEQHITTPNFKGCGKRILIVESQSSDELIAKPVDYEK
jgi:hypothetical protein